MVKLPHVWPISCKKDTKVDLVLAQTESAPLSNQSGIESCQGRSIELKTLFPRRLPMRSFSKVQTRFGADRRLIQLRATYRALRPTGVAYRPEHEGLSSIRQLILPQTPGRLSKQDGTLELLACYNGPTRREQFSLRSRYQGSLMGSPDSLTGRSL